MRAGICEVWQAFQQLDLGTLLKHLGSSSWSKLVWVAANPTVFSPRSATVVGPFEFVFPKCFCVEGR